MTITIEPTNIKALRAFAEKARTFGADACGCEVSG
jgi:hypothetical protein